MRFVQDHNLIPATRGRVANHLAQFAHLIDTAIGGRIDFENIEGVACSDLAARIAFVAGLRRRAPHAVKRFGQDSRGGGFSNASCTRENISVRHSARGAPRSLASG